MRQWPAGARAGDLTVFDDRHAVHQDKRDALGVMMWIVVCGRVPNGCRIECHEIGPGPGAQLAAALESEGGRRQAGHLADGIFEPEHFQFAHVPAEHPRVVAVAARMGNTLVEPPHAAVRVGRASPWLSASTTNMSRLLPGFASPRAHDPRIQTSSTGRACRKVASERDEKSSALSPKSRVRFTSSSSSHATCST